MQQRAFMEKNMRPFVVLFGLALAAAFSQEGPGVAAAPDLDSLYERIVASQYVVTGTVLKTEAARRWKPPGDSSLSINLEDLSGGRLLTIAVDNTVCRQSDFAPDGLRTGPGDEVNVFVAEDEPLTDVLIKGARYLLFLKAREHQAALTRNFTLDPAHAYYQAV